MQIIKIIIIILCPLLFIALTGCKETVNPFGPNKGEVTGTITDVFGDPIEGVEVEAAFLNDEEQGTSSFDVSDDEGTFILTSVPLGFNEIRVEKGGFKTEIEHIEIKQSKTSQVLNFQLAGRPQLVALNATPTVLFIDSLDQDSIALDTLQIFVTLFDEYNNLSSDPVLIVKVRNNAINEFTDILNFQDPASGGGYYSFTRKISFSRYEPGEYTLIFSAEDADLLESNQITRSIELK